MLGAILVYEREGVKRVVILEEVLKVPMLFHPKVCSYAPNRFVIC